MKSIKTLFILSLISSLIFTSCSKKPSKALYSRSGKWTGTFITLTNFAGLVSKDSTTATYVFTKDGKVTVTDNGSSTSAQYKWAWDDVHEAIDMTLLDANGNPVGNPIPYTVIVTKGSEEKWVGYLSFGVGDAIKSTGTMTRQ